MRKILISFCCYCLFIPAMVAQGDYSGSWKGAIELPGINLELSIDLKRENKNWSGDMDIPLQKAKDLRLTELVIDGRKCSFKLPDVPGNASFTGDFDEKAEKLEGVFMQSGQKFPMKLARESAVQHAASARDLETAIANLRQLADSLRKKRQVAGLGFGIVKEGKILIADGYGYRNIEQKLPVTANTQFAIGSSTKAFTTATLGILVDEGKLDWETPVVRYMPDFQLKDEFATHEMTAIDLSCHRSGLPRHDLMWYGSSFKREDIYKRLRYLPPNKSFRTAWQYNNLMYMTAGVLVERLSGKPWESFTQEKIFEPLGMKNSNLSVADMSKYKEAAVGYRTEKDRNIRMDYRDLDAIGPAGNINSTVNDMLKWVMLHLNEGKAGDKQVISEASVNMTHQAHMLMSPEAMEKNKEMSNPAYGLGWFVYRYKNKSIVEHGGNIDGFTALVYLVPEAELGMVILVNQNGAGLPGILARYATDAILGLEYTDWYKRQYGDDKESEGKKDKEEAAPAPKRIPNTVQTHANTSYTGDYEHPGYGVAQVFAQDKTLYFKYNAMELPLEHWHYDVFRAQDTALDLNVMLNFQSDEGGNIYQFSINLDPLSENVVFQKIPPRILSDPAFQQKLIGKYRLEGEQDMPFTIMAANGRLTVKLSGQPSFDLEPFQGTAYKIKGLSGYAVEFMLDAKGNVEKVSFNQPNGVFNAKKE